ncbi:hypothetical protein [Variovorax boronicumulans]|uniref:hypothetical protein n=1 Tax=Variovorax boronicumulans TaxID=436515 RepID=UPI0012E4EFA1|nr:hypothetical protein [Variovorax boronicumulans]GER16697.1 hypothetical protein VCH24_17030 [Variovorax boronicumulans]
MIVMNKRQLQLRIEVNVTVDGDRAIGDHANDALADLINRVDFKAGRMPSGRVLEYGADFDAVHVSVDLHTMNVTLS